MNKDKEVLEFIKNMERKKVISYKKLWDIFWLHPRKIASIMRQNKHPEIYPCYKVVNESWKIWWYSAYDWISSKIEKLKNDWIEIKNSTIDKKYFY